MNKQTPESDKNKIPEVKPPELPESIMMPEIKQTRDEVKGRVEYSVDANEVGRYQSVDEALKKYDAATANVINQVSANDPSWLQKTLQSSRQAWAAGTMAKERIDRERQQQKRRFDLMTQDQQRDWLKLQRDLAEKQAAIDLEKTKSRTARAGEALKGFLTTIGHAIGAVPASVISGWQEVREESKKRRLNKM